MKRNVVSEMDGIHITKLPSHIPPLPQGHNWHPSVPSGEFTTEPGVITSIEPSVITSIEPSYNYKCVDCDIEICANHTHNIWVVGYFGWWSDEPIPSCEEGKMNKALE